KNTKAIFFESPGSITFEIIEIDQLIDVCKQHNLYSIIDNTWGTPLYFKPFDYGIDISLHAGTKYIVGHSDTFIGAVSFNQRASNKVEETFDLLRLSTNADDAYQASKGLRTIKIRMEKQFENTIKVCEFLHKHKNIEEILYPPFEHSRDHNLWKKYFKNGGASLMTIILRNTKNNLDVLDAFIDELKLFGIGASWGGYESLIIPVSPNRQTTDQWDQFKNSMVRLHIGLEDPEDLIEDLKYSLNKF
ncbi:MAG: PLP-dependent transferase, partial [Hyphomicrobiales bacterium]